MDARPSEPFDVVVIGAGLPRTDTMSLRAALNILLEGKVYHMGEVFLNGAEHAQFWMDMQDGRTRTEITTVVCSLFSIDIFLNYSKIVLIALTYENNTCEIMNNLSGNNM